MAARVACARSAARSSGRSASAVVAGVALIAARRGLVAASALIAYTFSAFVLASIVLEFVRGTAARQALGGVGWAGAFSSLVARNRRRYGGYVVHAAIVLLAIGVAGSSAYQTVREARLQPGQSMTVGRLHARLTAAARRRRSRTTAQIRALLDV